MTRELGFLIPIQPVDEVDAQSDDLTASSMVVTLVGTQVASYAPKMHYTEGVSCKANVAVRQRQGCD